MSVETNYSTLLGNDSNESTTQLSFRKPLGVQANSIKQQKGRLYALERITKASRILVSRSIVFSVLDALVRTLSFNEISVALAELGLHEVQAFIDFLLMYQNISTDERSKSDGLADGGRDGSDSGCKVLSVVIKVFICQNERSMNNVARYCSDVLLQEAKGKLSFYSFKPTKFAK